MNDLREALGKAYVRGRLFEAFSPSAIDEESMAWIEKTITDLTTKGSALIEEARVMVEQAEKLFDKSPLIRALAMVFAEIPRASEPAPAPETGGGKI